MSLQKQLEKDYISALKAKDQEKVAVLRMLKAALKNLQVQKRRDVTEQDVLDVLVKQAKQRQDSIVQFLAGGRQDLADVEAGELAVIKAYLPEQLEGEDLEAAVRDCIAEVGAKGPQDMGRVMKALLEKYSGRVDGKAASAMVRRQLLT
ncbi:MAG TPA: GatB/YqeY domain-containing protein [Desulfomicrobiaceae bacterium]|nr:GatB/YqeY domain-containing protein [Desulfomicrobiaceae bacterium]